VESCIATIFFAKAALLKLIDFVSLGIIRGSTIKNLSEETGISEPYIYSRSESSIHVLTLIFDFFLKNSRHLFRE